ncbi:MAG: hypothetical protein ACF8QF_14615 [Phycisphaerales bacterium]
MRTARLWCGCALVLTCVAGSAEGGIETVSYEGAILGWQPELDGFFQSGDRMRYTFSYDTASADVSTSSNLFGAYPGCVVGVEVVVLRAGSAIWTGTLNLQSATQMNVQNFSSFDKVSMATGGSNIIGPSINGQPIQSGTVTLIFDPTLLAADPLPPADLIDDVVVPNQHSMNLYFGAPPQGNYGVTAAIDTGAAVLPCPSDLNEDGVTDGSDLGLMLGAWGTPAADMNGDGTTDGADLGVLLGAWGGC